MLRSKEGRQLDCLAGGARERERGAGGAVGRGEEEKRRANRDAVRDAGDAAEVRVFNALPYALLHVLRRALLI